MEGGFGLVLFVLDVVETGVLFEGLLELELFHVDFVKNVALLV